MLIELRPNIAIMTQLKYEWENKRIFKIHGLFCKICASTVQWAWAPANESSNILICINIETKKRHEDTQRYRTQRIFLNLFTICYWVNNVIRMFYHWPMCAVWLSIGLMLNIYLFNTLYICILCHIFAKDGDYYQNIQRFYSRLWPYEIGQSI